jgi:hypothetical protein
MSADVSIRRVTLLKLLPKVNAKDAEGLIQGLVRMAKRLDSNVHSSTPVLMTMALDITVANVMELVVGEDGDRISAKGVHTLVQLYEYGFFTGSHMAPPAMVSRISTHMRAQAA